MQKEEKRAFIRLKAYHLVKYRPLAAEKEQAPFVLATVRDIGAGGICLKTEEDLPVSSLIELKINFPPLTNPISTLAKVIWTREIDKTKRYEVGLQFVEIDESMRKIIDEQAKFVPEKLKKKTGFFARLFGKGG